MEEGAEQQQQPQQQNHGVVLDEEAIFFKQEQRRETAARRKRRRAEEKTEQVKRLKSQEGKADESDKKFLECLKKLKVKELKVLCEANHLFKSGSKPQLIERIFSTKKHGGAGPCPNCAHNLFIFYNKRTHDPNSVECRNTSLYGESCAYNAKIARSNKTTILSHKLRDTKDGFLLSVGITLDQ